MSTMSKRGQKDRHVSIRLSAAEAEQLERVAAANKLGVATWVRRAALLAAEREDPEARRRRIDEALKAIRNAPPLTPEQARRLREARERPE